MRPDKHPSTKTVLLESYRERSPENTVGPILYVSYDAV